MADAPSVLAPAAAPADAPKPIPAAEAIAKQEAEDKQLAQLRAEMLASQAAIAGKEKPLFEQIKAKVESMADQMSDMRVLAKKLGQKPFATAVDAISTQHLAWIAQAEGGIKTCNAVLQEAREAAAALEA